MIRRGAHRTGYLVLLAAIATLRADALAAPPSVAVGPELAVMPPGYGSIDNGTAIAGACGPQSCLVLWDAWAMVVDRQGRLAIAPAPAHRVRSARAAAPPRA
jgi:hypothetical protein